MDPRIGQTIDGRFRLDRLIGTGGMGKVYAATQLSVGHAVAVKLLRSDISELHTTSQRFFREAQVMASLRHPNIVGLVDYGKDPDTESVFIVMELVDGRSLTDLLNQGRISLSLALLICRQVCSGLAQAHAAGIVHRDLKPDNIMLELTAEGRICAKLLDFGIALPQGPDETRFTATGGTPGTPRYMSPEQAQDGEISVRSDFYALGVILYEMIAGHPPFQADTPLAVLFKTVHERHTPITEVLKGVELPPGPVAELIDDLLAKSPTDRPASAVELGQRLDRLIAEVPPAPAVTSLDSLDTMTQPAIPIPAGLDAPRSTAEDVEFVAPPPQSRSILPLLLLGVALIATIVVVAAAAGAIFWATLSPAPAQAPVVTSAVPDPATPSAPIEPAPVSPVPEVTEPQVDEPDEPDEPKSRRDKKPKKTKSKRDKKKPKRDKERAEEEYVVCQRKTCNVDLKSKGATIVCQAEATCKADCLKGECQQRCMGATCDFDCRGGGCTQACFSRSTCTFSCRGGNCSRSLLGGDVTELD